MTSTTINATINSTDFALAATRIDVWHEGGGIGHWEIMLDNSSGASQILDCDYIASLGINGATLMQGTVDDVNPEVKGTDAVFSKYVKVMGRNYGHVLADRFLIKNYVNTKFDDLIENVLSLTTDTSEITFTSPHTGAVVDANFNKTYLQNGFVDAAKLIDYDFTVKNDKAFELWSLSSAPSSGILLKSVPDAADNNILSISETKTGVDKRDYIRIDAGKLSDHWTEGNASDWTGEICTAENEYSLFTSGASSIRATTPSTLTSGLATIGLQFPLYNYNTLDFSEIEETGTIWIAKDADLPLGIYLTDDEGNIINYMLGIPNDSSWHKKDFKMGLYVDISAAGVIENEWHHYSGSTFTWRIVKFAVGFYYDAMSAFISDHYWVDGLVLPNIDVYAIAWWDKNMGVIRRSDPD